ncbi:MAG: hypothetical protein V4592_01290 [Bacteroidota bacterium]
MKKLVLVSLFAVSVLVAKAQPYFDVANAKYYSSPGGKINSPGAPNYSLTYFTAGVNLPIRSADLKNVFIASPYFERWGFSYSPASPLQTHYSSMALPLSYIHTYSAQFKILYSFIPRVNYQDIGSGGITQLGGAVLGTYQAQPLLAYKLGLFYNKEFFGNFFVPLVGIDWRINPRNKLFGVLPGNLTYEHKVNPNFYYGLVFNSVTSSYRQTGNAYIRINEYEPGFFADYYLYKNLVLNGEAGHTVSRKIRIGQSGGGAINMGMQNNYYFKLSMAYRLRFDADK